MIGVMVRLWALGCQGVARAPESPPPDVVEARANEQRVEAVHATAASVMGYLFVEGGVAERSDAAPLQHHLGQRPN